MSLKDNRKNKCLCGTRKPTCFSRGRLHIELYDDTDIVIELAKKEGFKMIPLDEIPEFSGKCDGYLDTPYNRFMLDRYARYEAETGRDYLYDEPLNK